MSDPRRFSWEEGDVIFDDEPVEKHYLYMHDQETHAGKGTRTVANESKYIKRGNKMLAALKKAGGLKAAQQIFLGGKLLSGIEDDDYDDWHGPKKVSKTVAKKWAGIIDFEPYKKNGKIDPKSVTVSKKSNRNKSISSAISYMDDFFGGSEDAVKGGKFHDRVEKWMSGKADHGLAVMWAATQLAIKDDSVLVHRGMEVDSDTLQRVAHGDVKLVDVDTIGHWSEDIDTSDDFSDGGILFIAKVPKKDILYTHRLNDFGFESEQEVVPMFSARPKVREFHVNFDEMSDSDFGHHKKNKGHKHVAGEHPLDARLIVDLEFVSK